MHLVFLNLYKQISQCLLIDTIKLRVCIKNSIHYYLLVAKSIINNKYPFTLFIENNIKMI